MLGTIRRNWLNDQANPTTRNQILQLATYYTPISILYGLYFTSYDFYVPISDEYSFYRKIFEGPRKQILAGLKSLKNPLVIPDLSFGIEAIATGGAGGVDYVTPGATIFDEV